MVQYMMQITVIHTHEVA